MKHLLIVLLLFSTTLPLTAQLQGEFADAGDTYYVAVIKGTVSYNGRPLKKRDKIKPRGELRFSSKEDYLKVSGPGGVHTLKPEGEAGQGGEFFTALREELFPLVRMRGSFAASMAVDLARVAYFGMDEHANYVDGTAFRLDKKLYPFRDRLVIVVQTADGRVVSRPVPVKDSTWVLSSATFAGLEPIHTRYESLESGYRMYYPAAIAVVNYPTAWQRALDTATQLRYLPLDRVTLSDLEPEPFTGEKPDLSHLPFPNYNDPEVPATLLNFFNPRVLVDWREMKRDLKRQVRAARPGSVGEFLYDMYFDEYIEETYGNVEPYGRVRDLLSELIEQ